MNMTKQQEQISKTVSFALRHRPDFFNLKPDSEGWVPMDALVKAVSLRLNYAVVRQDIEDIIAISEKKRFEFNGDRIRATYGHSFGDAEGRGFQNKIEFKAVEPPRVLYHGTSERAWAIIQKEGLKPMGRQYVHLSSDVETAHKVGLRHDRHPIILSVNASKMYEDGWTFFHSGNDGTWMCEDVPAKYILN